MGWLSTLGKLGSIAADFIPGGSTAKGVGKLALNAGKIAGAAGDLGSVLGGQQGGKNNALAAQANLQGQHDRNAIDLFQAQQQAQNQAGGLDLQRKNFEMGARGTNAKQAMIGALLGGGVTPTSIGGGHASGGLLRSLNGNPEALAAMKMLGSQGSNAQSTPMQFQGGQMLAGPHLAAMPKMDTGGGVLGTITKIAQLAGAASPYLQHGGGDKGDAPQGLTRNAMGSVQSAPVGNAFQGGAVVPPTAQMLLQSDPQMAEQLARLQFQQNGGRG